MAHFYNFVSKNAHDWILNPGPLMLGVTALHAVPQALFIGAYFFKWAIPGLFFLYFRLFNTQLTVNKCSINFANDWIRTAGLWYRKRPLFQLSHTTTAHGAYFR